MVVVTMKIRLPLQALMAEGATVEEIEQQFRDERSEMLADAPPGSDFSLDVAVVETELPA